MVIKLEEFVGTKFGKYLQLEVLPWEGEIYKPPNSNGGDKIYSVYCSVCAKDTELYGNGIFKMLKSNIIKGNLPCGCSKSPRFTTQQYEVKVNRVCQERGYKVNKFLWGDGTNLAYKCVDLTCLTCGHSWDTTAVTRLCNGIGCPRCAQLKIGQGNSTPDDVLVKSFMSTGSFLEGTTFTRTSKKTGASYIWHVTCPICSNDDYVKAGVCSGLFPAVISTLQSGALPCRCAKNHVPTKSQREYELSKIFAAEPQYSFVRWDDEERFGTKDYIWVNCCYHGDWRVRVGNFAMGNKTRCPDCSGTGGYSRDEDGHLYVLSVVGCSGNFTGYGISNTPKIRLGEHKRNLAEFGFKIENQIVLRMTGDQAPDIEKMIKSTFPRLPQEVEGFKTEATYAHLYDDVVNFVKERVDNAAAFH